MRGKDAQRGIPVWATVGGVRRPAVITALTPAARRVFVSFTDTQTATPPPGKPGGLYSASCGIASLEARR